MKGKKNEALKWECWKWDVEVLIWWVGLVLNSLIGSADLLLSISLEKVTMSF